MFAKCRFSRADVHLNEGVCKILGTGSAGLIHNYSVSRCWI